MEIDIIDTPAGVDNTLFKACVLEVLAGEHKTSEYVNIIFLGRDDLRLMKNEYFKKDVYTDVIAFNLNDPDENIEGEIYLSYEQIIDNAKTYETIPSEELNRVLIHGCLHLCGYEDNTLTLKAQMTELENHYMAKQKDLNN
ncbi:MAG: rRNA maturation RNase YbeY [Candidatus Marinimicrobia bacterium]|nr:rRNA maturation RNase YbeY [Candidatus Neomarinimicrobiota bacterium]